MYYANSEGNPKYIYSPPNLSTNEEFEEWEQTTMDTIQDLTWIKNCYWKLEIMSCVLVPRNKRWFESNIQELEDILNRGGLVALVADRDLSKSGISVEFFNARAKMPAGPALLALRTEATLITAYVAYNKTGIHINFSGPFSLDPGLRFESESEKVSSLTQLLANQFVRDISKDPTSWHMQQRIFIDPEVVR